MSVSFNWNYISKSGIRNKQYFYKKLVCSLLSLNFQFSWSDTFNLMTSSLVYKTWGSFGFRSSNKLILSYSKIFIGILILDAQFTEIYTRIGWFHSIINFGGNFPWPTFSRFCCWNSVDIQLHRCVQSRRWDCIKMMLKRKLKAHGKRTFCMNLDETSYGNIQWSQEQMHGTPDICLLFYLDFHLVISCESTDNKANLIKYFSTSK